MAAPIVDRPGSRAQVRYLRLSASKARVVLDLIRGLPVAQASRVLALSERGVSRDISKLLDSAVANAEHNEGIPGAELMVSACWADEGPTLKRFRPRARGRAGRINKRTCHITIEVARLTDEELDAARERAEAKGTAATDAAEARRRRVAASRGDDEAAAPAEETSEEVVADETPATDAAAETSSADEAEATDGAAVEASDALAEEAAIDEPAAEAEAEEMVEAEVEPAAEPEESEAEEEVKAEEAVATDEPAEATAEPAEADADDEETK